jgi:peptide/nickel transport system substrate-binding protein
MLADLVKAGKLPSVDQRIPSNPRVIKPLEAVGKYGGTWHRAYRGPSDRVGPSKIVEEMLIDWDAPDTKTIGLVANLVEKWEQNADASEYVFTLRQGLKWSDGAPVTTDDVMFWYEDIYLNKNIVPTPFFEFQIDGKDGKMRKIDDYTVAFDFPEPYTYFVYQLAGSTGIGGGLATRGAFQNYGGAYAPAHYLKQFLPKYSSEEAANKKAKDLGFDSWVSLLKMKYSWALNNELPTMTPCASATPLSIASG